MRIEDVFNQPEYPHEHPFLDDPVLPSLLERLLPPEINLRFREHLAVFGTRLVTEIRPLASLVHAPTLVQYDTWGRRIDDLRTSEGWRRIVDHAITEGFMSDAYRRRILGEHARVWMFAKTLIAEGDYNVITCPFAMTDGAARVIELYGTPEMKKELFPRLISKDPKMAYISGQWMTERPGGSDVSHTETTATPTTRQLFDLGDPFILNGFKWFSSAAEGNISIALARTGDPALGSRSLSAFVIPLRTSDFPSPLSNGIRMHRLKNKVGTHGLPTAELELGGTRGWLVGPLNAGVKTIALMLNITRVHSAVHSVGSLARALSIARAYATVRMVYGHSAEGGTLLKDLPLHMASLADVSLLYRALTHFTLGTVLLLGKSEAGTATPQEVARLRLLTPVLKAYAAEKCPEAMMECLSSLGGQGYMEEVGIGRLIRDSMVEKIWEGTPNVLALDLVRAARDQSTLVAYIEWVDAALNNIGTELKEPLSTSLSILRKCVGVLPTAFSAARLLNGMVQRPLLNLVASLTAAIYLLEHACWSCSEESKGVLDIEAVRRWTAMEVERCLGECELILHDDTSKRSQVNTELVYGTIAKL